MAMNEGAEMCFTDNPITLCREYMFRVCIPQRRLGAVCVTNGKRNLISNCLYGGKNAGNRKTCKKHREARPEIVAIRLRLLGAKMDGERRTDE